MGRPGLWDQIMSVASNGEDLGFFLSFRRFHHHAPHDDHLYIPRGYLGKLP